MPKNVDQGKFKVPLMGVKSKLPVSKEKLLKPQPQQASLKHRHSSPIKEPTKNISKEVKDVHLHPQFQPQPLSRPAAASQAQVLPSSVQAEAAVASATASATTSMAQPQKVATASAFPIEASRVNLNWISIPINSAEAKTEVIALKNSKSALVRVVMQIKDCSEVS